MTASPFVLESLDDAIEATCAPAHDFGLVAQVLSGLSRRQKVLPPALFYDAVGAELFERICDLDEYYVTRAELSILRARVGEIAVRLGRGASLIEYGSGAGLKVRLLLDAMEAEGTPFAAYVPIDISREQLVRVAADLSADYPLMPVLPVCGDYTAPLTIPELPRGTRRVAFFPGSTIGNFHPNEAASFLRCVRRAVGPGGALLLGVDRRKDARVLHAAYDDRDGVTAAFNLNALAHLNREFGADFDLRAFRHRVVWNERASRVEMHLVSTTAQVARVSGARVSFASGETIWTESSYKYDTPRLQRLARQGGFQVEQLWTDEGERFWVALLHAAGEGRHQGPIQRRMRRSHIASSGVASL